MTHNPSKKGEVSFKGAVSRDQGNDSVRYLWVFNGNAFNPILQRLENIERLKLKRFERVQRLESFLESR